MPSFLILCLCLNLGVTLAIREAQAGSRAPAPPAPAPSPVIDVDLIYAQSNSFWKTINDVKGVEGNLDEINQVLNSNYGTYQMAFGRFFIKSHGFDPGLNASLLKKVYLDGSLDSIAFGTVENPVVPVLRADVVLSAEISEGFEGSLEDLDLHTKFGGHFGEGYEKRINAVSTDLIQSIPTQNGHLTYFGVDAGLGRSFQPLDEITWNAKGEASETLYLSAIDGSTNSYQSWKIKNDFVKNLEYGISDQDTLTLETVLGPQPLPVAFLPRTWEYVDQLDSFPELGAMSGAGLAWGGVWGKRSRFTLRAGFYGGYLGGEAEMKAGDFRISVESWGIEASSAYQTLGQRLWAADLGLTF